MQYGPYYILEQIGSGGMAEVFRAREEGPEGTVRDVALKRILPRLARYRSFTHMLLAEARLSAKLQHPQIVRLLDFGEIEGAYFLALELVEGCNLRQLQKLCEERAIRLPQGLACHIVLQVAAALAYAHACTDRKGNAIGIVHRDISPSNIMISFLGQVKLVDFGIAKAASSVPDEETRTGVIRGKLGYMSPEQTSAKVVDRRSDIFALGVVFHECLVAARLFKGDDEPQTLELIRRCDIKPPSQLAADVDPCVDAVVMKMLAPAPADRYGSCEELIAELLPLARRLGGDEEALERFVETIGLSAASRRKVEPDAYASSGTETLGSVVVNELAPGVILYKMSGFLNESFVPELERPAAALVERGLAVELFFDAETMIEDTVRFRQRMTNWHNALKPMTLRLHVLVRSKAIGLAVTVVNIFTGGLMNVYSNRVSFEAALEAAIERAEARAPA